MGAAGGGAASGGEDESGRGTAAAEGESMNGQRILHAYNDGCQVERDGEVVDIQEDVPPFAVCVLGRADRHADAISRDERQVWRVQKPGASSSLYRPEILAINGPAPIKYKGYGEVTQDWPALARVALTDRDGRRVDRIPHTHESWGVRNDSWSLTPNGGLFTNLGLDTTVAAELGGTEGKTGKWSNLQDEVVAWVRPRPPEPQWMIGWRTSQTIDYGYEYDPLDPYGDISDDEVLVDPRRSVKYRLQQPRQAVEESVRLFEPIADSIDHSGREGEVAAGFQADRAVRWVRVREAGTYQVDFSAAIALSSKRYYEWVALAVFAAWPNTAGRNVQYKCIPWPAGVASRRPPEMRYGGTEYVNINDDDSERFLRPVSWSLYIADNFENVSSRTIMELGAGWAFGFVALGQSELLVHQFQCTVQRLGQPSNVEAFWEETSRKIDYLGNTDWLEDEEDGPPTPDLIDTYPVTDPETVLIDNQPSSGYPAFDLPDDAEGL
jgi:hypothetical protein